jgi:hypothetical protein
MSKEDTLNSVACRLTSKELRERNLSEHFRSQRTPKNLLLRDLN